MLAVFRNPCKANSMNNSELVSQLEQLVATSRFSRARKACLAKFIGKQYSVRGILSRVSNTTGYLRRRGLRKGKTITLQITGSDTELSIKCDRARSVSIADHNVSEPFHGSHALFCCQQCAYIVKNRLVHRTASVRVVTRVHDLENR